MTQRTDGIQTVEEAWNAAKLEDQSNGQVGPADADPGATPAGAPPTPPSTSEEQPSGASPELQSLIDSLAQGEQPIAEGEALPIEDPRFWQQKTTHNGEELSLAEMRNGYMRHGDYTQKTQDLAEQRRTLEDAAKLYESYVDDPSEFARSLAVEYGWLEEDQTAPVVEIDLPPFMNPEALDARLEEMLDERMSSDPRVQEAEALRAQALVAQEFDRIESELQITIPVELRQSLIAEAQEKQIYDFEILLKARLSEAVAARTPDNLFRSGAARPRSAGGIGQQPVPVTEPKTIEEAWQQAKAEAGL